MAARTLDDVLELLARYRQRAIYGAVGGVLETPAAFLMANRPRNARHSWVVNAKTHLPTGYTRKEIDPALRERRRVIASAADF